MFAQIVRDFCGILAVGGDDGGAGCAARIGVSIPLGELAQQPRGFRFGFARHVRHRVTMHFAKPVGQPHGNEAEAKAAAELGVVFNRGPRGFAGLAGHGDIDGICDG